MCVLQDIYVDEPVEYWWSFTPEINEMNGMNFTGPNLTLTPHYNETGNYICYANTNSTYTKENQSNATTIQVLRKLVNTTKQKAVRCMLYIIVKLLEVIYLAVFKHFPAISMEVQVTSNMDTVLDIAPYNKHTLNCTVSHESFALINGTLNFTFDNIKNSVFSENISHPGPYTAFGNVSESEAGTIQHVCNVTLIVEVPVNSTMHNTTVEVVGKCQVCAYDISVNLMLCTHFHRWKSPRNSHTLYCDFFNYQCYC